MKSLFVPRRIYSAREKWLREISFGLFSFLIALLFFYLTTRKRAPFTLSAAVGFVVLGVITQIVLKQAKGSLLLIFSLLPFYPFIRIQILRFELVGNMVMFVVSRWTEFLMILAMFGRKLGGIRRIFYAAPLLDFLTLSYLLVGLVYFVQSVFLGRGIIGMWGMKEVFLFYLYYFLVRFIPLSKKDLKKYLILSAGIGTAIAAFGCIQAQFFGMDFLKILGYGFEIKGGGYTFVPPTYQRQLPGGITFVRAISILQDALSLGAYLMLILLVLQPFYLFPEEKRQRWWKHVQYIILLLGLLYTTTRSAWIGMAVGTVALAWRRKKLMSTLSTFLVLGFFCLLLLLAVPGGKEFLYHSLFTGQESSAIAHMSMYEWQIRSILDNPLGTGLGMTGRVGKQFRTNLLGGFGTECWYLSVGTQIGVLGFLLYVAVVLETLRSLFFLGSRLKDPFLKDLAHGVLAAYLACSVFAIFLDVWSFHVIPIFMHLWVGMALFHFPHLDRADEKPSDLDTSPRMFPSL